MRQAATKHKQVPNEMIEWQPFPHIEHNAQHVKQASNKYPLKT